MTPRSPSVPIVGRFAPTPSGRMHLGNLFTALIACLSAKSQGGKWLLRIEDLDRERCPRDAVSWILDDLAYFGFPFEGEILYQSARSACYQQELNKLEAAQLTYPCYCSRAQLHAATAPHGAAPVYSGRCRTLSPADRPARPAAIRLMVPDEVVTFTDVLFGPYAENLARECGDFIVRRSDGVFSYQLAVVCDDARSGVTEVVRGADLLPSTARQIYLYRLLGYPVPRFFHLPLVLERDGTRMSKRAGCSNLEMLRRRGCPPDAILGMLAYNAHLLPAPEPISLDALLPLYRPELLPRTPILLDPCGLY